MSQMFVDLGEYSYPVYVAHHLSEITPALCKRVAGRNVIIVSNDTIAQHYLRPLIEALSADESVAPSSILHWNMQDGEQYKTLETYQSLITFLLEQRVSRDAVLIALGGGVVGDLTGFVAATYQRGIDFIQMPTTLLSQVDSSVGGKTAVNHPLAKNMIGAFYQPKDVFITVDSLSTLPDREYAAGMAEVVKYGIIYDHDFFNYLYENQALLAARDAKALEYVILRCCAIKAEIVNQDEKEQSIRAWLNLGHTFGHAIEAEMGYGSWLHGEAVAAGMMMACQVALNRDWIRAEYMTQVKTLLEAFDLPVEGPSHMTLANYLSHMSRDKKVKAGTIRFVIPEKPGKAGVFADLTEQELSAAIQLKTMK